MMNDIDSSHAGNLPSYLQFRIKLSANFMVARVSMSFIDTLTDSQIGHYHTCFAPD